MRSLVILVAVALVVYALRRLWRSSRPADKSAPGPERMVQCARCGIYIPDHEALSRAGRSYCSRAHLEADQHDDG